MRDFGIELIRLIASVWSRVWRWVIRSKKNLIVTVVVLGVVGIVWASVRSSGDGGSPVADRATESESADSSTEEPVAYSTIVAVPIADNSSSSDESSASEKADQGTLGGNGQAQADRAARTFLTAYLDRDKAGDDAWQAKTAPTVSNSLATQLPKDLKGLSDGDYPARVASIRVLPTDDDLPVDNSTQWSRPVQVNVTTKSGAEKSMTYALTATDQGDGQGWLVTQLTNDAEADS